MAANPSYLILVLIASVAATIWLISARYLANSPGLAARRSRDEGAGPASDGGFEPGPTTIVGGIEVEGSTVDNSRKLGMALARDGIWPGGPIQITERRNDRIVFVSPGDPSKPGGEIRLTSGPLGGTRFDFCIRYPGLLVLLRIGWALQATSLVVLAVGFWVIKTYVASSTNPAVRWQSVQMFQISHLLWPPFMLGYQYRSRYRLIRRQVETILANLPHRQD